MTSIGTSKPVFQAKCRKWGKTAASKRCCKSQTRSQSKKCPSDSCKSQTTTTSSTSQTLNNASLTATQQERVSRSKHRCEQVALCNQLRRICLENPHIINSTRCPQVSTLRCATRMARLILLIHIRRRQYKRKQVTLISSS